MRRAQVLERVVDEGAAMRIEVVLGEQRVEAVQRRLAAVAGVPLSIEPQGWLTIESLKKYAFQYLGIKINGRKYIYINTFPSTVNFSEQPYLNWKTEPIIVCDGLKGFWGALFDVEKLEFSELKFNGLA